MEDRRLFATGATLTISNIRNIIARAESQAIKTQAIAIVDREGAVQAIFAGSGVHANKLGDAIIKAAIQRARTVAFFESRSDAFTTRTARFIIQDHFPQPVPNTPGGPLYGVEFSSLGGSDILSPAQLLGGGGISGDAGGIPLFKGGEPVGAIGVAGDGHDVAPRADLIGVNKIMDKFSNPHKLFFAGQEEPDFDEAVALAGAENLMAPAAIRASDIFLEGLRFPFTGEAPASGKPLQAFADLNGSLVLPGSVDNAGGLFQTTNAITLNPSPQFAEVSLGGVGGQFIPKSSTSDTSIVASAELSTADVRKIITQSAKQAVITRGAIRLPIGASSAVHITVVDLQGNVLGAFRTDDATRFSYDVAVQKARTALFFSDDQHAVSTRAVGFLAQGFDPPGINSRSPGPLFHIQNELSLTAGNFKAPLKNGITIFPGGVPLYSKAGKLIGAVGVSGDGVDQDDLIVSAGAKGFEPPKAIRSDELSHRNVVNLLRNRLNFLNANFKIRTVVMQASLRWLATFSGVRLPYVKFPRNPNV